MMERTYTTARGRYSLTGPISRLWKGGQNPKCSLFSHLKKLINFRITHVNMINLIININLNPSAWEKIKSSKTTNLQRNAITYM